MESFVKSLSEDMKQQDLDSDENQFVLALAGIVTILADFVIDTSVRHYNVCDPVKDETDPDTEVCLHALRLLQSVILEPEVLAKSASEMRDTLPFQRIIALSKSRNADLQALAKELLEDLKILELMFGLGYELAEKKLENLSRRKWKTAKILDEDPKILNDKEGMLSGYFEGRQKDKGY
ncbi:hypothetical protein llap_7933 [Limosa lapponica baueri]|uniref:Uncharacterized protein n=1 Tax=Limosa lapponica baueri TaxID=1758121 RepID=A0A2I0U6T0_LIMLA|nr:hypothetical protein llap_7933 [Limosa lapponica baueri]